MESYSNNDIQQVNDENKFTFEYICLVCNKLFTSNEIVRHTRQNKDHIDHCFDFYEIKEHLSNINYSIKDQLIDTNNSNNKNNNENIFKKRIETLWSSLKRLSTTHSSLNSKMNEITNHFKIYYDYLMSKEHSLKKQIQDDIDLISQDITHQVNEFKSIMNIVNLNISDNTINNSTENDKDFSSISSEDTTNKYTIPSIIESIQQSKSYKSHNLTFNSSLSEPTQIKSSSINIDEKHLIIKVKPQDQVCDQLQKIIEDSIIINEIPSALVRSGDLERLKQYYKRNNINKLEYNGKSRSNQQAEIKETIIEILKSNRIDILEYLFKELHFDIKTEFEPDLQLYKRMYIDILAMSTIYSNLETIQFIEIFGINNNIKWKYDICLEVSPFSNNIEILQYFSLKVMGFIESFSIKNIYVSCNAALMGNFDMIKWISLNSPFSFKNNPIYKNENDIFCMDVVARKGYLDIIKWLHENRTEGCTTNAIDNAAENGHLETIKWLHHNRTEGCTTKAMDNAAENGHLETIKWLHENRNEGCTVEAIDYAACYGHLETIKWLHENRTEGCTTIAMNYAAWKGHLETIKWLHHNRTEGCTTYAMDYAAMDRHLETIKWLHHNRTEGCTTKAMNYAAWNGHLETIKWLHENRTEGCTDIAMNNAALNGHLEIIKWLHHNRTEGSTTNAMAYAKKNGHLETVLWLNINSN